MAELNALPATFFIVGTGIQQFIQLLDPFLTAKINDLKTNRTSHGLPGGLSDVEFKKAITAWISFLAALFIELLLMVTGKSAISLLVYVDSSWANGPADILVTAMTLGAGTEGMNTLLKYIGYVKDAKKVEASLVAISIVPGTVSVKTGVTAQLRAQVSNAINSQVVWAVVQGNGGTIDANGLYTAPAVVGTYYVSATAVADPTKVALAVVTVT